MREPKRRKINQKIVSEDPDGLVGNEGVQQDENINIENDMNWEFGEFSVSDSVFLWILTPSPDNNQDVGMNVNDAGPFRHSSEVLYQYRLNSQQLRSFLFRNLDKLDAFRNPDL